MLYQKELKGFINKLNAEVMSKDVIVNVVVKDNVDKTTENVKKLNKEVKQTETATKDTSKATDELGKTTDGITGGMVGKFKGLLSSIKTVITSFGVLKTAIIGTGLGALLILIVSIKQAFTASEEGQNKFAKLMGIIGAVVGNLLDILADLGDKLIWIFTHPKQAILDFVKLVKENIINRFNGLLELIPQLGKAINALFSGNFKEAGKIAGNAVAKVTLGVENMTDKINQATEATKKFIEEQQREAKIASEIADQRAKADRLERGLIVKRAEADRKIADLRDKAVQKDIYNVEERIKFLQQAQKIENDITDKEIEAAKLRRDAKKEENKLSKSNKEAKKEEEELKAKVIELETKRLQANKALNKALYTARQEALADAKALATEREAKRKEEEKANAEKLKAEQDFQKKITEQIRAGKKAQLDAEEEFDKQFRENTMSKQALELEAVDEKYFLLIERAKEFGYDIAELEKRQAEERDAINKAYADKKKADDEKALADAKALETQKIAAVQNTFTTISSLANTFAGASEEQQQRAFKVQKAANTANALIDTYKSATGAYASLSAVPVIGPALGAAAAGAAIAAGLANVKAIQSQKFSASGSSSGASSPSVPNVAGNTSTQQLSTPNFNVVGASGISQTENLQPVKAYVVSGDVTSAQALDRNRIQNATF